MKKRIILSLTALSLVTGIVSYGDLTLTEESQVHVSAESTIVDIPVHTPEEIKDYFDEHPFSKYGQPQYKEEFSLSIPYYPGKLSDEELINGLNALNCMRYIAGLDEVEIKDEYNVLTQTGALLNAVNGELSHFPDKPLGMDDELYETGFSATSSSNLGYNYSNLANAVVDGFIRDRSGNNIQHLGHRRWCLNPGMKFTGFGMVDRYTAMYSFDRNNSTAVRGGVCWPAQNMPVNYCDPTYIWNYTAGYRVDINKVSVTLTRKSDSKTWKFSKDKSDGEFYINNDGYGITGCVIFRPADITQYSAGDVFNVSVRGLESDVDYTVNFFDLNSIPSKNPVVYGDVNDDGSVTVSDIIAIIKFLAYEDVSVNLTLSDINKDNYIDIRDAMELRKMFFR